MMKSFTKFLSACLLTSALAGCLDSTPQTSGEVRLTSSPEGASIKINGEHRGSTPLTLTAINIGSYRIDMSKDGYQTAIETLQILPGQNSSLHLDLEEVEGMLLIHSSPQGADVKVGGSFFGKTPLLLPDVSLGNYQLEISKEGYLAKSIDVEVVNRIPMKLDVDLSSDSGSIDITSKPEGAIVFIDGLQRGVTPELIDGVPTGGSKLEVRLTGHTTFKETITLYPGQTLKLEANLKSEPGTLTILSEPSEAKVYIDNQLRGRTPYNAERLKPGTYRIRVESEGFSSESKTAEVKATDSTTLEFRLTKNSGELLLVTEPAEVKVFLNGRYMGATDAGDTDVLSIEFSLDRLPRGTHTLELVRRGYFNLEKTITIEAGEVLSLHETLKQRFIPDTIVRRKERPEAALTGVLRMRHENGDIELEVSRGVIVMIPGDELEQVKPIIQNR